MAITTKQIELELTQLEQSEAIAAPYYLKRELRRRKAVKGNTGRPVTKDDPINKRWREASKRYREKP